MIYTTFEEKTLKNPTCKIPYMHWMTHSKFRMQFDETFLCKKSHGSPSQASPPLANASLLYERESEWRAGLARALPLFPNFVFIIGEFS